MKAVHCPVCGTYIGENVDGLIVVCGLVVPPECPNCGAHVEVEE